MRYRNRDIPQDWRILERHGFMGFPTRIRYHPPNAEVGEWISRRQRKQKRQTRDGQKRGWWESVRLSQWMCFLFMIGSFAFTAGALLSFVPSLPAVVPGGIFFLGSLFFTSAAYLQFLETINTPPVPLLKESAGGTEHAMFIAWQPYRIDWWSTVTQFIGTLFFNISTFNAFIKHLSVLKSDIQVWSPDVFGSVLFLVSSWLAYGEASSALTGPRRNSLTWWVVFSNLLGSIAFGVAAITSFLRPSVGEMISATATNLCTALGGACFFLGAFLQLLETNRENAEGNRDNADNISISPRDTSHVAEGQK